MNHLIVPVDHSERSWRAFEVAVVLARRTAATIEVIEVVFSTAEMDEAKQRLSDAIAVRSADGALADVAIDAHAAVESESVAAAIEFALEQRPGSVAVMASHGRGRSAALLGSVTDDVLRRTFGPVIVVGPHLADQAEVVTRLDGPVVVAVDGSDVGDRAAPLGAAWAIELGVTPWIVEVHPPRTDAPHDVSESGHAKRLATGIAKTAGHAVEWEVLHGQHPDREIVDFADRQGASMIVAGTHGRTGLERVTLGSVSANIVRHATCPVVLLRPPELN